MSQSVNTLKMSLMGTGISFEKLFLALPIDNVINLVAAGCFSIVWPRKRVALVEKWLFSRFPCFSTAVCYSYWG